MAKLPRGLETKRVCDWNNRPIGTILGSELDPKTHDPRSLIIGLDSDAREMSGVDQETVELPFDLVFGIRRDQVRLSRSLTDLMSEFEEQAPEVEAPSQSRILEMPTR